MEPTQLPTSEVLYRAADLIEERGWGQGSWSRKPGDPLCIEGAILVASGLDDVADGPVYCPASLAVRSYLGGKAPFIWNDALFFDRHLALIHETPGSWEDAISEALEQQARAEGQAKVIAVLRAAAVIEAAREKAEVQVLG